MKLLKLFYEMYLIRSVEKKISLEYPKGNMRCPVHLSIGQEACAVGISQNLKREDVVYSNHRCHAHYIAKGGNISEMISEIHGKKNGCVGGVGGSMHLQDLSVNFMASIPIVSSSIGLSLGAALNQKRLNSNKITVVYIGDASLEEGIFFECANFASLHKLPILFACENNLFSVYTPLKQRQINSDFKRYADAFKIPYKKVNGNNIEQVFSVSKKIIQNIKNGKGPYFLQMDTYRHLEHCGPNNDDHLNYRNKTEVEFWKKKDPLIDLENKLRKKNDKKKIISIKKNIDQKVEKIFVKVLKEKYPTTKDAKKYVYAI